MTGIRILRKHLIPVCDDRHSAEAAILVHDGAVIKGNAVTPVHLHQRRVETAFVLLVQVLFLQGKPDDELLKFRDGSDPYLYPDTDWVLI